ncbi:hypothetical protein HK097_006335, partial [Rhizophlyctis rosea]
MDTTPADNNTPTSGQQEKLTAPFRKLEYIWDGGLKQLLQCPTISAKDKKELRKLKRFKIGPNCYEIQYNYGQNSDGRGRLYGWGLQCMRARTLPLRQYLCGRQYHDIDQVNSTPMLYLHLLKKNNLVCPELENYVQNRQECLDRWSLDKRGFLILLNKATIAPTAPEVHAIHDVLYKKLMPILRPQYPDIANKVLHSKDPNVLANRSG